jgi:uncharacterized protein (TIGR00369 family)
LNKEQVMPALTPPLADWLSGQGQPPIAGFLGLKLTAASGGTSTVELAVGRRHHNPIGTVHGGILGDLADAAMGTALATLLAEGETFTTTDLGIHFLAPVLEGTLHAQATVVRRGRHAAYVECDVTTEDGAQVAKAHSTCFITVRREGSGKPAGIK